jgi:hypothetical protein
VTVVVPCCLLEPAPRHAPDGMARDGLLALLSRVRPAPGIEGLVGKAPEEPRQDLPLAMAQLRDQTAGEHQAGDQYASQQGQWVTRGESGHVLPGAGSS